MPTIYDNLKAAGRSEQEVAFFMEKMANKLAGSGKYKPDQIDRFLKYDFPAKAATKQEAEKQAAGINLPSDVTEAIAGSRPNIDPLAGKPVSKVGWSDALPIAANVGIGLIPLPGSNLAQLVPRAALSGLGSMAGSLVGQAMDQLPLSIQPGQTPDINLDLNEAKVQALVGAGSELALGSVRPLAKMVEKPILNTLSDLTLSGSEFKKRLMNKINSAAQGRVEKFISAFAPPEVAGAKPGVAINDVLFKVKQAKSDTRVIYEGFNNMLKDAAKLSPPPKGAWYHGTSAPIKSLDDNAYASLNYYGQGFYSTNNLAVAKGYTKKGRGGSPTLYNVKPNENIKFFDMEKPLTPEDRKILKGSFNDYENILNESKTLREAFDELRREGSADGFSADSIQGYFDSVRYNLENKGYRGLEHLGGKLTKTNPHEVRIYWFPSKDINLATYNADTMNGLSFNKGTQYLTGIKNDFIKKGVSPKDSVVEKEVLKHLGFQPKEFGSAKATLIRKVMRGEPVSGPEANNLFGNIFKTTKTEYKNLSPMARESREALKSHLMNDLQDISNFTGIDLVSEKVRADSSWKSIMNFSDLHNYYRSAVKENKETGRKIFMPYKFAENVYNNKEKIVKTMGPDVWTRIDAEAKNMLKVGDKLDLKDLGMGGFSRFAGPALGAKLMGPWGAPIVEALGAASAYSLLDDTAQAIFRDTIRLGSDISVKGIASVAGKEYTKGNKPNLKLEEGWTR